MSTQDNTSNVKFDRRRFLKAAGLAAAGAAEENQATQPSQA